MLHVAPIWGRTTFPVQVTESRTIYGMHRVVALVRTEDGQGAAIRDFSFPESTLVGASKDVLLRLLSEATFKLIDAALDAHRIDCEMRRGWPYRECIPEKEEA